MDKSKLGQRFTCFSCGTKFYDLNRPQALCPECGTDQVEAPAKDMKALLKGDGRKRKKAVVEAPPEDTTDDDMDDVDDLFDDDDDDDDDLGDDDDDDA